MNLKDLVRKAEEACTASHKAEMQVGAVTYELSINVSFSFDNVTKSYTGEEDEEEDDEDYTDEDQLDEDAQYTQTSEMFVNCIAYPNGDTGSEYTLGFSVSASYYTQMSGQELCRYLESCTAEQGIKDLLLEVHTVVTEDHDFYNDSVDIYAEHVLMACGAAALLVDYPQRYDVLFLATALSTHPWVRDSVEINRAIKALRASIDAKSELDSLLDLSRFGDKEELGRTADLVGVLAKQADISEFLSVNPEIGTNRVARAAVVRRLL